MQAPDNLGPHGAKLYRDITEEFDLRPDELATLELACHELDVVKRLERAVDELGSLRTKGSMNQDVAAPELSELRQHSLAFASLVARLKLSDVTDEEAGSAADRAPFSVPMSRTEAARRGGLAKARTKRFA